MADTIEKISDNQIKITSTITQSRVMSVDMIKSQIDSMTKQLADLQAQLDQATQLGVKSQSALTAERASASISKAKS